VAAAMRFAKTKAPGMTMMKIAVSAGQLSQARITPNIRL
jgi:hypothetical protein